MQAPFCQNGGLTIIPLPGFLNLAENLKKHIESMSERPAYEQTPVDIAVPEFKLWPSGETYVELSNTHICGHDCVIVGSGPGTDAMIMKLLWTIGHAAGRHARRISVVTGYFPQSRSDADEGEKILTLLPMVMAMATVQAGDVGIHRWICADPHCKQLPQAGKSGKITPIYLTRRLLTFALSQASVDEGRRNVLAFPDHTAKKRYDPAIKFMRTTRGIVLPTVTAFKEREDARHTEVITMVGALDQVREARVLMFDDEIATGGSVIDMARRLKEEYGAHSVWACATHGVLCGDAKNRFLVDPEHRIVNQIIVTDTIPVKSRLDGIVELVDTGIITVYSWLEDLAWVIIRNHWDMGVREIR